MLKTTTSIINASQIATPISFAGDVTLSTGNLVIGTAGKGIDFSADPSAAGMTSELLDDYEEGTWTPAIMDSSNDPTELPSAAYTTRYGVYTKIGNRAFVNGRIVLNSIGTLNTAQGARFTLPFATNGSTGHAAFSIGDAFGFLITAGQSISAYAAAGGTFAVLQLSDSTSGVSSLLISELTATGEFVFSGSFQV